MYYQAEHRDKYCIE